MDVDLRKTSAPDQMDVMQLKTDNDKFPQFSQLATPPTSISFMGTPIQGPMADPKAPKFNPTSAEQSSSTRNSVEAMREMIFCIAMMQPVHIDPESVKPPKRRNVKISKDPQSVAARHRRERISERIRILQRLVPEGTKMDTASMLDEAVHYVKFLKKQVQSLEKLATQRHNRHIGFGFAMTMATAATSMNNSSLFKAHQPSQIMGSMQLLR